MINGHKAFLFSCDDLAFSNHFTISHSVRMAKWERVFTQNR